MNEKVILPRFDLPQDSTRVAMRTLWAAGGLVVLATLILGLAMWRHRAIEIATAEEATARAAAARRAAMAPPVPAAAPAIAEKVGEAGTARIAASTTLAAVAPTDSPRERVVAPSSARPRHSGKSSSKARMRALIDGQKSASVKSTPEKSAGKKSRSNDDVIDRLLNGYK
jgi:hypothetical protein